MLAVRSKLWVFWENTAHNTLPYWITHTNVRFLTMVNDGHGCDGL